MFRCELGPPECLRAALFGLALLLPCGAEAQTTTQLWINATFDWVKTDLEMLYPINRPNLTADGTIHAIADWEWFVPFGDPSERFANRRRLRLGVGYRRNRVRGDALARTVGTAGGAEPRCQPGEGVAEQVSG